MMSPEEDDQTQAMRKIAEMISDFRREYIETMQNAIVKECDEVAESEYDLARGNGRGPWWADGG